MSVGRRILLALVASTICLGPLAAQNSTLPDAAPAPGGRIAAVTARHGMVVAQEARAARIGMEILRQGGNAVDAAVATGFALAVTYPRAGNIGGGGYMLDAPRRVATSTPPSTIARPRRPRPRPISSSRARRGRPAQVTRLRARDRSARHGGGALARAREIRLGQVHPRATDRAGDHTRARRHSDRGRYRGFVAALAGAPGALALSQ